MSLLLAGPAGFEPAAGSNLNSVNVEDSQTLAVELFQQLDFKNEPHQDEKQEPELPQPHDAAARVSRLDMC
jgi:hypothetical protein